MIHGIGNKCLEESLVLSSQEVQMNEMTTCKLLDNLLKKIPREASWHYIHDIDLSYNEMFSFSQKIFENCDTFVSMSKNIAKHLSIRVSQRKFAQELFIWLICKGFL